MLVKLYRKQKKAVATSLGDPHFIPDIYQTDWYFEEDKTDEELIAEVKQTHNISDDAWFDIRVIQRFVDAGTVNLRK